MLPLPDDPRFKPLEGGEFRFACHPGVPCFNQCCRKLNLVLTPYDILRLKNRLGITCQEFIQRYAKVKAGQNGWPQVWLLMTDPPEATCPFLSPEGCLVYPDRPGACRTYPLGRAAKGGAGGGPREEAFFLVREDHCRGFEEGPTWTPEQWMKDQGLSPYNRMNDRFLPLITRQAQDGDPQVIAKKMRMFALACYDLEGFRRFVFETSLTRMFEISQNRLERMRDDDEELLLFAFDWLGFSIFGDPTLHLRAEVTRPGSC